MPASQEELQEAADDLHLYLSDQKPPLFGDLDLIPRGALAGYLKALADGWVEEGALAA